MELAPNMGRAEKLHRACWTVGCLRAWVVAVEQVRRGSLLSCALTFRGTRALEWDSHVRRHELGIGLCGARLLLLRSLPVKTLGDVLSSI